MAAKAACQISVRVLPLPALTSKIEANRLPKFMTSLVLDRLRQMMPAARAAEMPAGIQSTTRIRARWRQATIADEQKPDHAPDPGAARERRHEHHAVETEASPVYEPPR